MSYKARCLKCRINISIWAEGAMKQSHLNLRQNGLYKTVPVNNPYIIKVK